MAIPGLTPSVTNDPPRRVLWSCPGCAAPADGRTEGRRRSRGRRQQQNPCCAGARRRRVGAVLRDDRHRPGGHRAAAGAHRRRRRRADLLRRGVLSLLHPVRLHHALPTALVFTGFVAIVDFFLVAMVILGSLEMFASPLGTWIPFMLIFLSTWLTGHAVLARRTGDAEGAGRDHRQPIGRAL